MALTRLERKEKNGPEDKIQTADLFKDLIERLNTVNQDRTAPIKSQIEECQVAMDKQHLERLATILLDNALKYTPADKSICVTSGVENGKYVLRVKDKGIGISSQDRKHIFERFYRVDKARNRQSGGNGLGLSLAWELVQLYHGKIEVFSQSDQGSEFVVTLPKV